MKNISVGLISIFLLLIPVSGAEQPDTETASRIIGTVLADNGAYKKLQYLTDRIGNRLAGTENMEKAVLWAVEEFRRDGLHDPRTEKVMVPHWVRRAESCTILSPARHRVSLSALGRSIGTPPQGISAEVVEVSDFDHLHGLGDSVAGKIVLYNKEIVRNGGRDHGYGSAAGLRVRGAIEAARQGAVAVLVRSLGTANYRLPHTGMMRYDDQVPKIPAAAIAAEDAELIHRLAAGGEKVVANLTLDCENLPDVESANVIAELPGRQAPEEIVLLACHLDSWDVGTGATDDGAGCAMVMQTMRVLRRIDPAPRRTIRAVLYTAEETGIQGGKQYAIDHAGEIDNHVTAMEADAGAGLASGFGVSCGPGGIEKVEEFVSLLDGLGAGAVSEGGWGPDISPLRRAGVPIVSMRQDTTNYFDYHHSDADTLDKVDPRALNTNTAAMAVMAYMLANMEEPLPRLEPTKE